MSRFVLTLIPLIAAFYLSLVPGTGQAATVTLQQGVNGYSGCSDSFIGNGAYPDNQSQNFGSCPELRTWCTHYASW